MYDLFKVFKGKNKRSCKKRNHGRIISYSSGKSMKFVNGQNIENKAVTTNYDSAHDKDKVFIKINDNNNNEQFVIKKGRNDLHKLLNYSPIKNLILSKSSRNNTLKKFMAKLKKKIGKKTGKKIGKNGKKTGKKAGKKIGKKIGKKTGKNGKKIGKKA